MNLEIVHIEAHAIPGGEIGRCIKEAIEIAVEYWQNVIFSHNGKRYRIDVNDLVGCVKEEEKSRRG